MVGGGGGGNRTAINVVWGCAGGRWWGCEIGREVFSINFLLYYLNFFLVYLRLIMSFQGNVMYFLDGNCQ